MTPSKEQLIELSGVYSLVQAQQNIYYTVVKVLSTHQKP